MRRILNYKDFLTVENGHAVRYVEAVTKYCTRTVYRIDDQGNETARHLYYAPICGYLFAEDYTEWDIPGFNINQFRFFNSEPITERDKDTLKTVYPEFRWTMEKAGCITLARAMILLQTWLKFPKVELLIGAGLTRLAYNRNFLSGKPEMQKKVLAFIRKYDVAKDWPLNKIQFIVNGRGNADDFDRWQQFRDRNGKIVEYKWFKKYGPDTRLRDLYNDYEYMAEQCGHNMKDPYWRYPADIRKAHDKVMAELDAIREAEEIERKKKLNREQRNKKKRFLSMAAEFAKATVRSKGLTAYVPQDIADVKKQADTLHQCLIRCDYICKVANKKCLLVFITDNEGKPVATAEIRPNGKLGQFYADEQAKNIHPSKQCQKLIDKWLEKYSQQAVSKMAA